ncbi:GNAT family N-acetyltransferase, partial [Kitasatospora putterlickiae]
MDPALLRLEPWTDADLALLRLVNTPRMREHVGGPEDEERMLLRHRRYLDFGPSGTGRMYRVVLEPEGAAVGTVGYAERAWRGGTVYEMGWNVLPPYQGRGIAPVAAPAAVE